MTTTSGVGTAGGTSGASTTGAAAASSASASYTTFLTLLTTQLKNQDPLNPTNTDTFTSEMIQLSGVEQELAINATLSTISSNLNSVATSNGLGYIGKTVTASGGTTAMQNGSAQWSYTLSNAGSNVKLSVVDSNGTTVYTTTGDATSGTHNFTWNGNTSGGSALTSGDYTLKVSATDASGDDITTSVNLIGKVTGVDSSSGTTNLKIGDISVPVSKVTSINS
ncbi:MAG: hypothetical protein F8N37_16585 [Telmatospirillum sp.]|nr:hypothetical protein [Telmatospirillum sp.]